VGRQLREAGDAPGLFIVRFSKTPTSALSVPSNSSNSRLRSSLMESAPRMRASISPIVFSFMVSTWRLPVAANSASQLEFKL